MKKNDALEIIRVINFNKNFILSIKNKTDRLAAALALRSNLEKIENYLIRKDFK